MTCQGKQLDRGVTMAITGFVAGVALTASVANAEVVKVEITSRTPVATRVAETPNFELITGVYFGELDPGDPHNSIITDLAFAPRNARGRVEYSATFALSLPIDPRAGSGVLFYDTPNRGNSSALVDSKGHMHLVSGWQGDIAPAPGRQTVSVPVAHNTDGSPVTAPVLARFVDMPRGIRSLAIRGGIGVGVARPEPLTLDSAKARLIRKRSDSQQGEVIPSSEWGFADCTNPEFPGRPDPTSLCLRSEFDPAYAYELTYTGKDPLVLGIGFAAVRDLVTFLRYGADSPVRHNPIAGRTRKAIGTGVSQAGNFIRSFIRLGFNTTEDGRIVFDGANPHIAARQVPLNLRFAVPGGAAGTSEPGSEGVLWWGHHDDEFRGRGTTSLLDRCEHDGTCPKIIETLGSSEFWGLRLSPDFVGLDAKADIPVPSNVRRYYFPGTTHGGGSGGFPVESDALRKAPGCDLLMNPNPEFEMMRALTQALVAWVVDGKAPPPSRYPRLADGDLVPANRKALGFPIIPGAPSPDGKLNPIVIYDFGVGFRNNDLSGVMSSLPPRVVREGVSLVPRVDADGNETSGVASVQQRVPLGTYLGWNVQASGYYRGEGCGFQGGYLPFARTRAERVASGDPRLSLEERYGTHEGFVEKVRAAAFQLVTERFLLSEDADRIIRQAEASAVLSGN